MGGGHNFAYLLLYNVALESHAAKAIVLDERQILSCVMNAQFFTDQKTGKHRSHTSRDSTIPVEMCAISLDSGRMESDGDNTCIED